MDLNYTIESGDTLIKLADKYETTVDELALLNGIKDADSIQAGQRIVLRRTEEQGNSLEEQANAGAARIAAVNSGPSSELVDIINRREGFTPTTYWDIRQYTNGYGTEAKPGEKTITKEEAVKRRDASLVKQRGIIEAFGKEKKYNWTPSQLDALTSFRYNIGSIGQLTDDGKRSNAEIAEAMLLYNKAEEVDKETGKRVLVVLEGLSERREEEAALFKKAK
jgi:GH24 family phage-related lysozyme (muramidase)